MFEVHSLKMGELLIPEDGALLLDPVHVWLITDGTTLNNDYKRKLDQFVPYFQQLKDAGIPVLFRPLHEMNEGWAWWGGRPGASGSARLYQITATGASPLSIIANGTSLDAAPAALTAVPEPATLGLFSFAALNLLGRRRKNRR